MSNVDTHFSDSDDQSLETESPVNPTLNAAIDDYERLGSTLRDVLGSLVISKESLEKEVSSLLNREKALLAQVTEYENVCNELETYKINLMHVERKTISQEEQARKISNELKVKSDALINVKQELKATLESLSSRTDELETIRSSLSESERKRIHFEQTSQVSQQELRDKTKEFALAREAIIKQSASLKEHQARLSDTEEALTRTTEQLEKQSQELKDIKWQFVEQKELFQLTGAELTRKTEHYEQMEIALRNSERELEELKDVISSRDESLKNSEFRLNEREDGLKQSNKKVSELASMLRFRAEELAAEREKFESVKELLHQAEVLRDQHANELAASKQEVAKLMSLLKDRQDGRDAEREQLVAAKNQLRSAHQQQRNAEQRIGLIIEEVENLKNERESLSKQLADYAQRDQSSERRIEELKTLIDIEQTAHKDTERKRVYLENSALHYKKELDTRVVTLRSSEYAGTQLKEKHDLLLVKHEETLGALKKAQDKMAHLQMSVDVFAERLRKVPRLDQLESELEHLKRLVSERDLKITQQAEFIRILQANKRQQGGPQTTVQGAAPRTAPVRAAAAQEQEAEASPESRAVRRPPNGPLKVYSNG